MAMDGRYGENAGAFFGVAGWRTCRPLSAIRQLLLQCSTSGVHAVAVASEAPGLLPGEMQEEFSARATDGLYAENAGCKFSGVPWMAGTPEMQEHFPPCHGWPVCRPLSAFRQLLLHCS